MKYCKHCGKKIPSRTVFCPYCGSKQDFVSGNHASNQPNPPRRPRATINRPRPNPNLNMIMNNDKDDTTKKVWIVVGIIGGVVIGLPLILGIILPAISQLFTSYF